MKYYLFTFMAGLCWLLALSGVFSFPRYLLEESKNTDLAPIIISAVIFTGLVLGLFMAGKKFSALAKRSKAIKAESSKASPSSSGS